MGSEMCIRDSLCTVTSKVPNWRATPTGAESVDIRAVILSSACMVATRPSSQTVDCADAAPQARDVIASDIAKMLRMKSVLWLLGRGRVAG